MDVREPQTEAEYRAAIREWLAKQGLSGEAKKLATLDELRRCWENLTIASTDSDQSTLKLFSPDHEDQPQLVALTWQRIETTELSADLWLEPGVTPGEVQQALEEGGMVMDGTGPSSGRVVDPDTDEVLATFDEPAVLDYYEDHDGFFIEDEQ